MNQDQEAEPLALEAYETLAESYSALVDTKPHNAYYERPATLSLLPEVEGRRVLDMGCGPGVYAELLAGKGAEVVAVDVSEAMVRLARERLGAYARVLQADFGRSLNFLEDVSFDIVLSALALDYVNDWEGVFAEVYRILRPGGRLVFSVEHPCSTFMRHAYRGGGSYFRTELVSTKTGFGEPVDVPAYRRPLEAMINPLLEAGFVLERLVEPTPTKRFKKMDLKEYEKLSKRPGFLCLRAAKR